MKGSGPLLKNTQIILGSWECSADTSRHVCPDLLFCLDLFVCWLLFKPTWHFFLILTWFWRINKVMFLKIRRWQASPAFWPRWVTESAELQKMWALHILLSIRFSSAVLKTVPAQTNFSPYFNNTCCMYTRTLWKLTDLVVLFTWCSFDWRSFFLLLCIAK